MRQLLNCLPIGVRLLHHLPGFLQPSESRRPLPNLHFLGGDGVERGDSCRVDFARLGLRGAVRAGLDGELRALRGDATA
jgi:hypothetical protein